MLVNNRQLDPIALIRTLDKFSTTADYDKRVIRIINKVRKLEDTYALAIKQSNKYNYVFNITNFYIGIISVIASGYSIIGLATLFFGAFVPIIGMGSALVGKLVALKTVGCITIGVVIYHATKNLSVFSNHNFNIYNINGYLWFLIKAHLDQVKLLQVIT